MPSQKKLVGLRLDDETYERLQQLAREDFRSVAAMAELLFFRGLDLVEVARNAAGLDEHVLQHANATMLRGILRELRDQARATLDGETRKQAQKTGR